MEYEQLSLFDFDEEDSDKIDDTWRDGYVVKNTINNKEYLVKHDNGETVEDFAKDYGYLTMAKSDLVFSHY